MVRGVARVALIAVVVGMVVGSMTVTAPVSSASVSTSLEGSGDGHGRGLSQQGARARAADGQPYREILAAYYPGTWLSTRDDETTVRVRIQNDRDNVITVRAEPGLQLRTTRGSTTLPSSVAGAVPAQWRIRVSQGRLVVEALVDGRWRAPTSARLLDLLSGAGHAELVPRDGTAELRVGTVMREYEGSVRAVRLPGTSALVAVVVTTYTAYLESVVSIQVGSGWHPEAAAAQAVAARSLVLADRARRAAGSFFDTNDSIYAPPFRGLVDRSVSGSATRHWITELGTQAVQATAGRYLSYRGAPALAEFTVSNGGFSAAGWEPYLVAAPDPYDRNTGWRVSLSPHQLRHQFDGIGTFVRLDLTYDGLGSHGGRVTRVTVVGTRGSTTMSGEVFRRATGLRSAMFAVTSTGAPVEGTRDVVGDAGPDILALSPGGALSVWESVGPSAFESRTALGGDVDGPRTIVYNLTGNGLPDIVTVDPSSGYLIARPLGRDGTIGAPVVVDRRSWLDYDLLIGANGYNGYSAYDPNSGNDGTSDPGLLVREAETGTVRWFPGYDGAGISGTGYVVARGWGDRPQIAVVGDMAMNNLPDVATTDEQGRLWLYPNLGVGRFLPRQLLTPTGFGEITSIAGSGDWNRDGDPDILVTTEAGELWAYVGQTPGTDDPTAWVRLFSRGWAQFSLLA